MKTAKKFLLWVLVCGMLVTALPFGALAVAEAEDNNSMATAQILTPGEAVDASIADKEDADVYRIVLPQSGELNLNVTSYLEYYSIFLYDSTGEQMWCAESNQWNSVVGFRQDVYSFDLAAGIYFVTVNGVNHHTVGIYHYYDKYVGNYSLTPTFVSANTTETEPNNSAAEGTPIALESSNVGQIARNDRFDFYKLNLTESGQLALEITSYIEYYSLFLYDVNGNEVWTSKSNQWNATVGFCTGSYALDLLAGTYFLKVTGENHYSVGIYDHCESHTGNYSFTTAFTPSGETATESNNSVAEADVIDLTETINGQIAINDEEDYFAIALPEDGSLTMEMTSYLKSYCIFVYDVNGNELWNAKDNTQSSTVGFRKDVFAKYMPAGTYYIRVNGRKYGSSSCKSTGLYTLDVSYAAVELGDVDASKSIDFFDGMYTLQYYAGILDSSALAVGAADVDNSGEVNYFDTMYILQYYAGLFDRLPAEG